MYRANYPVDNPSDYWKISINIVLDHLVEEISKRVVSKGDRFFFVSYPNPASLLYLIPEIVDRLFNAYQRKVDFCG